MFLRTKILTVCSVASTLLYSATIAHSGQMTKFVQTKTVEIDLPSLPVMDRTELVLVCFNREALEDIAISGLYENAEDNQVCGLVEAGQLTYIGAVQRAYVVFIEGVPVGVGFYPVQVYAQTYALAWPNPLDPHIADPEYKTDNGTSKEFIRKGFPADSCAPSSKPILVEQGVMLATVVE